MENKQTAVDWFADITSKLGYVSADILEQAKQMEKQQIIDAFGVGCQVESARLIGYHEMSEQYYDETYGCQTN
jgi:hypothetical protein